MSPQAYHQRCVAPLKDGKQSLIVQEIINKLDLPPEQQKLLSDEKMLIWKRFQTPALMLMDEYANFKTLVNAKMLKGVDPTGKDIRDCLKLLLDISKEINRLSTVSADKKFEAFSKSFGGEKEIVIEVETEDDKLQQEG